MRRKRMKYEITVVGHRIRDDGTDQFQIGSAFCTLNELLDHIVLDNDMDIYAISARRRPEYEFAEEDNVIAVNFAERAREELNFEDQS